MTHETITDRQDADDFLRGCTDWQLAEILQSFANGTYDNRVLEIAAMHVAADRLWS